MTPVVRLLAPRVFGNRTIIPVIRETSFCHDNGMVASVIPVALIIGDEGAWGVALLEGESVPALLDSISKEPFFQESSVR